VLLVPDVNILLYAFRDDMPEHIWAKPWLESVITGPDDVRLPDVVATGFLRVVTMTRFFSEASRAADGLAFLESLRTAPSVSTLIPGPGTWSRFAQLVRDTDARGNRIPDLYLAAITLEADGTLCTNDTGLHGVPGLRVLNPRTGPRPADP
jgi:toxin-antitoxin system PIN domain toxin